MRRQERLDRRDRRQRLPHLVERGVHARVVLAHARDRGHRRADLVERAHADLRRRRQVLRRAAPAASGGGGRLKVFVPIVSNVRKNSSSSGPFSSGSTVPRFSERLARRRP